MVRFVFSTFVISFLFISPAFAGFEWVPATNSVVTPQPTMVEPVMDGGFPAPDVSSEPLAPPSMGGSSQPPVSILPREITPQPIKTKNLSGKKLVIDPYPLRSNAALPASGISMTEVYKAMNEKSGNLHPVKLGNGMTTGAKKKAPSIPKAVRMASTAHKTFLTPTGSGMTPMMGVEPPPLPGTVVPRRPVERVPSKNYVEAVGFGRDLPLALALSQVIPAEFTHGYAKNVDAGVSVSWEGGKPWNEVLNDMLRPQNLTAIIQDNRVTIQPMTKL